MNMAANDSMLDPDVIRPTLLVGSFPFKTAAETLELGGTALGGIAKRLTDGEPQGWNRFAAARIPAAEGIKPDAAWTKLPNRTFQRFKVREGFPPAQIEFGSIGYADIVGESFTIFEKLQGEGRIRPGVRLQQSLPSPFGVTAMYFTGDDIKSVFPAFERAMFDEVAEICRRAPAGRIALQWDVALEIVEVLERHDPAIAEMFAPENLAAAIARAIDAVPVEVDVGVHLCYGNPGGRHVVEPRDLENLVSFSNLVTSRIRRPLDWLHMPVPIERHDHPYFAALQGLDLSRDTEFYLGLVHLADGFEGASRRIAAARQFRRDFGVSTECGFRYVPEASVGTLLELHRQLAYRD